MATTERKGILTYVDEAGNTYLLYPITKAEAVDGLEEIIERLEGIISDVNDNMLPNTGGTMTGNIAMGGNKISGIGAPNDDGDATNMKFVTEYVDSKNKLFNVVLTVNDWEGEKAPYKQTIGIEGILGTDRPHYGPVYSEATTTMLAEKEAFSYVDDLDTADGSVTFTCLEDKPDTNVTVQMEVHR